MIRAIILMLAVSSGMVISGRPISPDAAMRAAEEFFGKHNQPSKPLKVHSFDSDAEKSVAQPYYIFNSPADDGGFVIIGGDDRLQRVLGYSDTGSLTPDNIPPQLADLLGQYVAKVDSIDGGGTHPSWSAPARDNNDEGVLLETVNWGQAEPYNILMGSTQDGQHYPAGCVATAAAIVMKYHNWPTTGRRKHKVKSNRFIDFGALTFDWHLMDDLYVNDVLNDDAAKEISKLMKAVGRSIDTNYGVNGSAANDALLGRTLFEYFRYSPDAQTIHAYNFTKEEWNDILHNEIDNNRPVIYGASSIVDGGHEFVCDGYKGSKYHINWGWDGAANGYFDLESLMGFNIAPSMTINISPDNSDVEDYSEVFIDSAHWTNIGDIYHPCGLNISTENIIPGEPFRVSLAQAEVLDKQYYCAIALAIVDENGVIKDFIYPYEENPYNGGLAKESIWIFDNELLYDVIDSNISSTDFGLIKVVTHCNKICETDRIQVVSRRINGPQEDGIWDFGFAEDKWKPVLGTLETPTSVPVKGASPKGATLSWTIDDGLEVAGLEDMGFVLRNGACHFSVYHGRGLCSVTSNDVNIETHPYNNGSQFIICPTENHYDLTVSFKPIADIKPVGIDIVAPGSLYSLMADYKLDEISDLTLTGNIDMRDLKFITENMLYLNRLDLSACKICAWHSCPENSIVRTDELVAWPNPILGSVTLTELRLPETLEYIGLQAISCSEVHILFLPASLSRMEGEFANFIYQSNAFCSLRLRCVYTENSTPFDMEDGAIHVTTFGRDDMSEYPTTLIVPKGSKQQYESAKGWNNFTEIVEMDSPAVFDTVIDGVRYIGVGDKAIVYNSYFYDIPEHLVLQDTIEFCGKKLPVKSIEHNTAFEGVWGRETPHLTYLTLNESLNYVNNNSFKVTGTDVIYALNRECIGDPDFSLGLFGVDNSINNYKRTKIYNPYMYRNIVCQNYDFDRRYDFYYPGGADLEESYDKEMWHYNIYPDKKIIEIVPLIEELSIDKVTIDGQESASQNFRYSYSSSAPEVIVDYTLHGRQSMSTRYTPDFNADVEDLIVEAADSFVTVYNLSGIEIYSGSMMDMPPLSAGIYILRRSDGTVTKFRIR